MTSTYIYPIYHHILYVCYQSKECRQSVERFESQNYSAPSLFLLLRDGLSASQLYKPRNKSTIHSGVPKFRSCVPKRSIPTWNSETAAQHVGTKTYVWVWGHFVIFRARQDLSQLFIYVYLRPLILNHRCSTDLNRFSRGIENAGMMSV